MNTVHYFYLSTITCLFITTCLLSSEDIELDIKNHQEVQQPSFESKWSKVTHRLEEVFKVTSATKERGYPLHSAITNNQELAFRALLNQQNCNVNELSPQGVPPLGLAAFLGKISFVKELLRHKRIAVNTTSKEGYTALHAAVIKRHPDVVELLLIDPRVEVNRADTVEGFTPVHSAIREEHRAIFQLLLPDPRTEVNRTDNKYGCAPFHLAVITEQEEMIKPLLAHPQIDVNILDSIYGCTALFFASLQGNKNIVALLLNIKDLDVNCDSTSNRTPLRAAALNGDKELAFLLIEHGAENDIDATGQSCLDVVKDQATRKALVQALLRQEQQRQQEEEKSKDKKEAIQ